MRKKLLFYIAAICCVMSCFFALCACGDKSENGNGSAVGLVLNKQSLELNVGDGENLTVTFTPTGTGAEVSWRSTEASVADVNSDGRVWAVGVGTARIVASLPNGAYDVCEVTVKNAATQGLSFKQVDGGYEVSDYDGESSAVVIPSMYEGKSVIGIGMNAFKDNKTMYEISVPDSVTYIDKEAFGGCVGLIEFTVSEYVTRIGERAFSGCDSLVRLVWNAVDVNRPLSAFGFGALKNVVLGDKLKAIPDYFLSDITVQSDFRIPDSVTSIGYCAFNRCKGLKSLTVPEGVTSIGAEAFSACAELNTVALPKSLKELGVCAFENCYELAHVSMDCGIEIIRKATFASCFALDGVVLPESVTVIDDDAFYQCDGMSGIAVPDGVTKIGDRAFAYCRSLTAVKLPVGLKSIGIEAFSSSGLREITVPDGVTKIGDRAFIYCNNLTAATIPASVKQLNGAFYGCYCVTVYCEAGEEPNEWSYNWDGIDYNVKCPVVWDCKNNDVDNNGFKYVIKDGIKFKLKNNRATVVRQIPSTSGMVVIPPRFNVGVPYEVVEIGDFAFKDCKRLTGVVIPVTVTNIGRDMFVGCDNATVYCEHGSEQSAYWGDAFNDRPVVWGYKSE